MNSNYMLGMGADTRCNFLCSKTYSAEEAALFSEKIENEYTVNWILDELPGAWRVGWAGGWREGRAANTSSEGCAL